MNKSEVLSNSKSYIYIYIICLHLFISSNHTYHIYPLYLFSIYAIYMIYLLDSTSISSPYVLRS